MLYLIPCSLAMFLSLHTELVCFSDGIIDSPRSSVILVGAA
jgi:hypothetical protein